jgi:hypothetical protein
LGCKEIAHVSTAISPPVPTSNYAWQSQLDQYKAKLDTDLNNQLQLIIDSIDIDTMFLHTIATDGPNKRRTDIGVVEIITFTNAHKNWCYIRIGNFPGTSTQIDKLQYKPPKWFKERGFVHLGYSKDYTKISQAIVDRIKSSGYKSTYKYMDYRENHMCEYTAFYAIMKLPGS